MGASTSFRSYPASYGQTKIQDCWKRDVEQSLYEDGHSYSGEIGMLGTRIASWIDLADTDERAHDYITEKHQKWNPALAVSCIRNGEKYWVIGGWCSS